MYKRIIRIVALSLLLAVVTLLCLAAVGGLLFGYLDLGEAEIWSPLHRIPSGGTGVWVLLIVVITVLLWWRCIGRIGDDVFRIIHHWKKRFRNGKK